MVDGFDPSKHSALSIINALTLPQLVLCISTLFVLPCAGYWFANNQAENKVIEIQAKIQKIEAESQLRVNQISSEKTQLQLKMNDIESKLVANSVANDGWRKAYEQQLQIATLKNKTIEELSSSLGKVSNCSFVHGQILATKNEIKSVKSFVVFSGRDENKEELAVLEKRLALFQEQLGTCNK